MEVFNKEEYEERMLSESILDENVIGKGFIGNDGEHHEYEYDENDHMYHTHMTNFEFYSKNNKEKLEDCQKCSMWDKCSVAEHIVITMKCIENALTYNLTKEIDKKIVNDILERK